MSIIANNKPNAIGAIIINKEQIKAKAIKLIIQYKMQRQYQS